MNFEQWKAAAAAMLAHLGIDAVRIPDAQNYAARKAAAYAEVLYLNALSAIARKRHRLRQHDGEPS